jgi:hypothetical protein
MARCPYRADGVAVRAPASPLPRDPGREGTAPPRRPSRAVGAWPDPRSPTARPAGHPVGWLGTGAKIPSPGGHTAYRTGETGRNARAKPGKRAR